MSDAEKGTPQHTIDVRIKADKIHLFQVGTRWEVLSATLNSLYEPDYAVTLKKIETADE